MFLTDQGFKKIITEIYKGEGLTVANTGRHLILRGIYTTIEVQQSFLSKKALGAIIELTGFIPEIGEGWTFRKNEDPEFISEPVEYNLQEDYNRMTKIAVFSPVTIDGLSTTYNVMQGQGEKILVNQLFATATQGNIYESRGETDKEEGRYNDHYVIWKNNVMAVRATRIRPNRVREKELLLALQTADILNADTEENDE